MFDAGTGIRPFGNKFTRADGLEIDLYLTHTHLDHIIGLPFFAPLFNPSNRVRLWAGHLQSEQTLHQVLCKFMAAPLFPIPPTAFDADVTFHDFAAGETLEPEPGLRLRTAPLNHPNGATGYRIEYGNRSVCYVTDTEHVPGRRDRNVLGLIAGSDIVIYDSTFAYEEFPKFRGWGHSTWQEGVRLCDAAGAKRLVIFHHDPSHDDAFMDQVLEQAEAARPGTIVAQEGMMLRP